jgi:DNA-directed RNA polymerase subunit RPC12/RpoP
MELEERTIEQLPDRCQNCGAELTDAEKRAALTEGPPGGLVLCTTCAAEVVTVDENADQAEAAG